MIGLVSATVICLLAAAAYLLDARNRRRQQDLADLDRHWAGIRAAWEAPTFSEETP